MPRRSSRPSSRARQVAPASRGRTSRRAAGGRRSSAAARPRRGASAASVSSASRRRSSSGGIAAVTSAPVSQRSGGRAVTGRGQSGRPHGAALRRTRCALPAAPRGHRPEPGEPEARARRDRAVRRASPTSRRIRAAPRPSGTSPTTSGATPTSGRPAPRPGRRRARRPAARASRVRTIVLIARCSGRTPSRTSSRRSRATRRTCTRPRRPPGGRRRSPPTSASTPRSGSASTRTGNGRGADGRGAVDRDRGSPVGDAGARARGGIAGARALAPGRPLRDAAGGHLRRLGRPRLQPRARDGRRRRLGPGSEFILLAGIAGLLAGRLLDGRGRVHLDAVPARAVRAPDRPRARRARGDARGGAGGARRDLPVEGLLAERGGRDRRADVPRPASTALDTLVREELGLDPDELGSPWGAAFGSFVAFAVGAVIPVIPYLCSSGTAAFV